MKRKIVLLALSVITLVSIAAGCGTGAKDKLEQLKCEHEYGEEATRVIEQATCDKSGKAVFTCTLCGKEKTEVTDNLEHIPVIAEEAIAATCTTAGETALKMCSTCNVLLEESKVIPALGHKEAVDSAVAATCTEEGKKAGSHCETCNEVIIEQETVAALGHDYVDGQCTLCEEWQATEGLVYKLSEDGSYYDCMGIEEGSTETRIVIPGEVLGIPVKAVGMNAFYQNLVVETVVLGKGIETLEMQSFHGCKNLKNITFSEGLKLIDEGALDACDSLTSLILPEGLETIKNHAFGLTNNLTNVVFPSSLKELGNNGFQNLTEFECPPNLVVFGGLFDSNENIENFVFPETLEKITSDFVFGSTVKSITFLSKRIVSLDGAQICLPDTIVYVPAELLASYKADSRWQNYNLVAISEEIEVKKAVYSAPLQNARSEVSYVEEIAEVDIVNDETWQEGEFTVSGKTDDGWTPDY